MQIHIIAQYLNVPGNGEDRLIKLGREWIFQGHQVTVFTINSGSKLDLGEKKIGFLEQNGIPMVTFNAPYNPEMSSSAKLVSYLRFARLVIRQGRNLPRPDLIVAVTPPLTAAWAALKLSKETGAPLLTEVRELWPDALIERGSLRNRLVVKAARRMEEKIYENSQRIVACGEEIANAVKERWVERAKVSVVPGDLETAGLLEAYDSLIGSLKEETGFGKQ
jgi:hypothetical protein